MKLIGHPPAGYLALLRRNGNFRNLWFGEVVSNFGDWFNLIASATLIGSLGRSGLELGGLFVVRMVAPFLVSPVAGVAADRYNRKHLMIAADVLRALVVCGFLLVRSPADIWLLYTLSALQAALSGFFTPARNALFPDIVDERELGPANALSASTFAVMLAVGAAAGGFAAGLLGVYETFLVDAASYGVSALLIASVKTTHQRSAARVSLGYFYQQYADGLAYLRRHTEIAFLVMHKGLNAFFITGGLNVLTATIAARAFPLGEGGGLSMGVLYAVTGLGTGFGPLLARRVTGDDERRMRQGLVASYLISALGLAIAAPLHSFTMVAIGLCIRAMGGGLNFVYSTQLLMTRVPGAYRGRVFGTEYAIRTLLNALGTLGISLCLDRWFDAGGMLVVTAILALVPALAWWWWLRKYPL